MGFPYGVNREELGGTIRCWRSNFNFAGDTIGVSQFPPSHQRVRTEVGNSYILWLGFINLKG